MEPWSATGALPAAALDPVSGLGLGAAPSLTPRSRLLPEGSRKPSARGSLLLCPQLGRRGERRLSGPVVEVSTPGPYETAPLSVLLREHVAEVRPRPWVLGKDPPGNAKGVNEVSLVNAVYSPNSGCLKSRGPL